MILTAPLLNKSKNYYKSDVLAAGQLWDSQLAHDTSSTLAGIKIFTRGMFGDGYLNGEVSFLS